MKSNIAIYIAILIILSLNFTFAQEIGIFTVSPQLLEISANPGSIKEETLLISSETDLVINLELSQSLKELITIEERSINLIKDKQQFIPLKINPPLNQIPGIYTGFLSIKSSNFEKKVDFIININNKRKSLDLDLTLPIRKLKPKEELTGTLEIVNLGNFQPIKLNLNTYIKDINGNTIEKKSEITLIEKKLVYQISMTIPSIKPGNYFLDVEISSDIFTERITRAFSILEAPIIEKPSSLPKLTNSVIITLSLLALLILYLLTRNLSKKSFFILPFIILIILILIMFNTFIREKTEEITKPDYDSSLAQNVSNMLGLSKLTNEPFLKNITETFLIYIIKSSEKTKPEIKIDEDKNDLSITLEDIKLTISKIRKKYDISIISSSTGRIECNLLCIASLTLWTETVGVILSLLLIIILLKKRKHKEKITEVTPLSINQLISYTELEKNTYSTIRKFFISFLNLDYEATLEEISNEVHSTSYNDKLKTQISVLLERLNEFEYSQNHVSKKEIINEFNDILMQLGKLHENPYKPKNFLKREVINADFKKRD